MTRLAVLAALLLLLPTIARSAGPKVPVAILWGPDNRIHVALRDGRAVAAIDLKTRTIVDQWPLGFRPASLARDADGATLIVGGEDGELAALDLRSRAVRRFEPGRGPTMVLPWPGRKVLAGSRWDDAVRLVDLQSGATLASHQLPFPPGALTARADGRAIVADAFGSRLAVLRPGEAGSERFASLDGVNLHGLAISGDGRELLVAHSAQHGPVPVSESNVDWGVILSTRLAAIQLVDLDRDRSPVEPVPRRRITLDGSGNGAADPSALAVSKDGTKLVIAAAGAHQLLIVDRTTGAKGSNPEGPFPLGDAQLVEAIEVGLNPVGLAFDPTGAFVASADAMSDTVSIVRLDGPSLEASVAIGPADPTRDAVARGEAAFRDGRRSLDRWMSCASCHKDGHTNGLNFDTLGDANFGAPKNTPTLLGVGPTAPFTWTGRFGSLSEQVHQSFLTSLRSKDVDSGAVADVTAYLESLAPPPPRRSADDPAALRGGDLFRSRRCDTCHRPPTDSITATRSVGTDDGVGGHTRFNPPALLGVARTAPYLHDGRAATLADLLNGHHPGSADPPDRDERDDLAAFLESL